MAVGEMNNNTGIVFLALFGLIAVGAVVAVVASRGMGNQPAQFDQLAQPSGQPVYGQPVYDEAIEPQAPLTAGVLYQNEERWELRRGSDRLLEEIVIHRTVTQDAGR
ncbi:unnamed protein product [marine sediment metagenome]|uniref:Uncharacterized protein n=1 Tax=marine sediment metagenome TaxID=412755 RepID=X1T2X8_9ZZZZ